MGFMKYLFDIALEVSGQMMLEPTKDFQIKKEC